MGSRSAKDSSEKSRARTGLLKFIEFEGDADHVHLLVGIHPALNISPSRHSRKTPQSGQKAVARLTPSSRYLGGGMRGRFVHRIRLLLTDAVARRALCPAGGLLACPPQGHGRGDSRGRRAASRSNRRDGSHPQDSRFRRKIPAASVDHGDDGTRGVPQDNTAGGGRRPAIAQCSHSPGAVRKPHGRVAATWHPAGSSGERRGNGERGNPAFPRRVGRGERKGCPGASMSTGCPAHGCRHPL